MAKFPSPEWIAALDQKLNTDENYARVAHNWEGDMKFVIEPAGAMTETAVYYIDLWHGKCRGTKILSPEEAASQNAAFTLKAPYDNFVRILGGKLDPIQAMLTRKLGVEGNMVVMMRNVPTVLNFVRCCKEVTDSFI